MDKKNPQTNDDWLDEILGKRNVARELRADELAVAADGLAHPEEIDLERIVQETMAENWGEEEPSEIPGQQSIDELPETPAPTVNNDPLPKRTKKPYRFFGITHLIATLIWAGIILFVGVSLGRLAWVCAADLLALGKEPQEVTITLTEKDDIKDAAKKLKKAGMIRYPSLFESFADLTGKGQNLLEGNITFSGEIVYDYNALINAMSFRGGSLVTVDVMIPEGYNCAQIFALLEQKQVCSVEALEQAAMTAQFENYWWLKDVKRDHKYCLEGFLFPDTYEFYINDKPDRVLMKFLDTFDYRFSQKMIDKFVALNRKYGDRFTIYDVVTMASIVEKETANADESYSIASVFYNRLTHTSTFAPYLGSDATILYATDYLDKGKLTTDALINQSPYNTYTHTGLPPTPIANPGLESLDAALEPLETDYFYFVYDKSAGCHRFSKTLAQHQDWINKLGLK